MWRTSLERAEERNWHIWHMKKPEAWRTMVSGKGREVFCKWRKCNSLIFCDKKHFLGVLTDCGKLSKQSLLLFSSRLNANLDMNTHIIVITTSNWQDLCRTEDQIYAAFKLEERLRLAEGNQARNETKHTWTECHGWEQQSSRVSEGVSEWVWLWKSSAPHRLPVWRYISESK